MAIKRRSVRAVINSGGKEIDYGISSESSDDEPVAKKKNTQDQGEKIEKVLDVRDGPAGFVGNQTIIYSEAKVPEILDGQQTEKQYLIKVSRDILYFINYII